MLDRLSFKQTTTRGGGNQECWSEVPTRTAEDNYRCKTGGRPIVRRDMMRDINAAHQDAGKLVLQQLKEKRVVQDENPAPCVWREANAEA